MTFFYKLRRRYIVPHSGFIYESGEVFVSNYPLEKAAENHFRCKVWRLSTPIKPAIGSGLWHLLYQMHDEGYLEQIQNVPDHLKPHLRKDIISYFSISQKKMFYQTLLQTAEKPFSSKEQAMEVIDEMLKISLQELKDSISVGESITLLLAAVKRIDNTWNLVSKKTGGWIKQDAFSEYIKSDEELKKLLR